jgi:WD40 repeat protein
MTRPTSAFVPLACYCLVLAALFLEGGPPAFAGIFGANKNDVAVRVAELPNPDSDVYPLGLDFNADGSRIAVESYSEKIRSVESPSAKIHIWDWRGKHVEKTIDMPRGFGKNSSTNPISYSPDGLLLSVCDATGAGGVITRIWSTTTWVIAKDLVEPTSGICSGTGFTPDGQQFIRTADTGGTPGNNLIAYKVGTWQTIWGLPMPGFTPVSIAISPNGEQAAVAGTIFVAPEGVMDPVKRSQQTKIVSNVNVVDLKQRKILTVIQSSDRGPVAWSPDGFRLAVAGGPNFEIFDARSGQNLVREKIENAGSMNVRFTPDNRYLIESDLNGMGKGLGVHIWDGQRHKLLQHIPVGDVGSIAVSRDGKYLAIGETGRTTIWAFK